MIEKNDFKRIVKNERGSITVIVLVTMIFTLLVVMVSYGRIMNKNSAQLNELKKIQEEYLIASGNNIMKQTYENSKVGLIAGEGTVTLLEGEKVILPEPDKIGEYIGDISYSTTSDAITVDAETGEVTGVDAGAEKQEAIVVAKDSNLGETCEYKVIVKVWNGEGTEEDPYEISNLRDINKLDEKVSKVETDEAYRYTGKYFVQTDNIDLQSTSVMIGEEGTEEETNSFNGIYDGNNKEIQNLKIETDLKNSGLFTIVGKSGSVKNLTLASGSVNIKSGSTDSKWHGNLVGTNYGVIDNCTNKIQASFDEGKYICGGLVGANKEEGSIKNSYNYATITKTVTSSSDVVNNNIGAISGANNGIIENCTNSGQVVSQAFYATGGICGWNDGGSITNCTNDGKITSTKGSLIGGIAGTNESGGKIQKSTNNGDIQSNEAPVGGIAGIHRYQSTTITQCENNGDVSSNEWFVGGICGQTAGYATIEESANYGFIEANSTVGGIVGIAENNQVKVSKCVNYGNVLSTTANGTLYSDAGGVVGYIGQTVVVEDCYNKEAAVRGKDSIGGVAGANNGTINNCYNTGNSTSHSNGSGLGGLVGVNQVTGVINNSYTQTDKDAKVIGTTNGGTLNNASFKGYSEMISTGFVNTLGTSNWKQGEATPILIWQEEEFNEWPIEEGVYMFYTALAPTTKVMDVYAAGTEDGTNVQLYDMNYGGSQKFRVKKTGKVGVYSIINTNSNKSLDVNGGLTENGTNLQIWTINNSDAQSWRFVNYQNGYYAIQSLVGSYIHVNSGLTANGTNIHMWNDAASTNKNCQWMLKKAIE